jgi:hypothetical protein
MRRLKARETEDIPLVKCSPMALEIEGCDFTNRVCCDEGCAVYVILRTALRNSRSPLAKFSWTNPCAE